ncbi:capsid protein [Trichoplusia ni granulovirus LBIV-12]|uniref:Capsid protein n=1 Tax=Trichoplusia ni granulovirus LBIV-12 TaxID=1916701 RepID=A0A1D8QL17_GVTN|nr:capsid protein [Trichoplusia ni granulovirus LBIV-12]AOW41341.1 capsid protein [Trichoplusia ni granulovirus LBIV-12]
MDLLEFIANSGFRADGRQAIMRMRRNYDLKKQLESDVTHVQFNMDQCDEFLNTLLQMFEIRPRQPVYVAPQQPLYNPPVYTTPLPPPPPPTPTPPTTPIPIPRSRRSSYMSVDDNGIEDLPDFNHVVEIDRLAKNIDSLSMPPPPPPPPPQQIVTGNKPSDVGITKTTDNVIKPAPRDYLEEIKKGVPLKKVPPKSESRKTATAPPIMLAMRNKLDQRRQVTELSDHSEPNSDWSN